MENVDEILKKQRFQAKKWDSDLSQLTDINPIQQEFHTPNYWVYGVRAADKRKTITSFREQGFYASGVHINNNIYSIFGDATDLPGTNDFYAHFVALPCGWWMFEG